MRLPWPRRLFRSMYARVAGIIFFLVFLTSLAQLLILIEAVGSLGEEAEQVANWAIARAIADRIQPVTSPELNRTATLRSLFELHELNPTLAIFLLDESGETLLHYPDNFAPRRNAAPVETLESVLKNSSPELPVLGPNPVEFREPLTLFSVARIEINGRPGYVYVVFTSLSSRVLAKRGQFLLTRIAIASLTVIGFTTVLLGLALFYLTTKRYRGFIKVLREFTAGDFSHRIDTSQQDEVSEVGQAINSLAESVVAARAALEERDEIRRNLVADVSHDLRSPVAALQLRADLLSEVSEQSAFETVRKQTPAMLRSLSALQRLVADLFELTKIETARMLRREPVSVERLLGGVVDQLSPLAATLGVNLKLEPTNPAQPAQIELDAILMERLVTNLVENALRHSPERSTVTLRCSIENELILEVEDQGSGISTELTETLFARGKRSTESSGAGLGLAICRAIAELHGGTLTYAPAPIQGSIFRLELPLK